MAIPAQPRVFLTSNCKYSLIFLAVYLESPPFCFYLCRLLIGVLCGFVNSFSSWDTNRWLSNRAPRRYAEDKPKRVEDTNRDRPSKWSKTKIEQGQALSSLVVVMFVLWVCHHLHGLLYNKLSSSSSSSSTTTNNRICIMCYVQLGFHVLYLFLTYLFWWNRY